MNHTMKRELEISNLWREYNAMQGKYVKLVGLANDEMTMQKHGPGYVGAVTAQVSALYLYGMALLDRIRALGGDLEERGDDASTIEMRVTRVANDEEACGSSHERKTEDGSTKKLKNGTVNGKGKKTECQHDKKNGKPETMDEVVARNVKNLVDEVFGKTMGLPEGLFHVTTTLF